MKGIDELFRLEVVAAKLAWNEELSEIIRSAEGKRIGTGAKRLRLSEYIERFIEGGLEGNRYAQDGYRDEVWLLWICGQIVRGETKEIERMEGESGETQERAEFLRHAQRYIWERPLNGYGAETRARVYSVALHNEFMRYAAKAFYRELWGEEMARVGQEGYTEELGKYSRVEYLRMYLQGVAKCLAQSMEYVDEETGKQVSKILREQKCVNPSKIS